MNEFFKVAGDLEKSMEKTENNNYVTNFFHEAGDLNDESIISNENMKKNAYNEDVNKYLMSVVSGKEFGDECELGTLCGAGNAIVTLEQLTEMVEKGTYNIISAEFFNQQMIEIRFEEYNKELKMFK